MHTELRIVRALAIASAFFVVAGVARSQCETWSGAFGVDGVDNWPRAAVEYDDGSGSVLVVGGHFTTAGGIPAPFIAQWDGSRWAAFGAGMDDAVMALAMFDDGSGLALYAGGLFTDAGGTIANYVAKWNGTSWSTLGSGTDGYVYALHVFDDGSGPALYAGGDFTTAGGTSANGIARWNGTSWSALGVGTDPGVFALGVFDDGTGAALYAGGAFTSAGGSAASHVARWNGSTWAALGAGTDADVYALESYDDGSGAKLYAGGAFLTAGGSSAELIAAWDGASWSPLAPDLFGSYVTALEVYDDGSGAELVAGGYFTYSSGSEYSSNIVGWNGTAWSEQYCCFEGGKSSTGQVVMLAAYDLGGAPKLAAGGDFDTHEWLGDHILSFDGTSWSPLGGDAVLTGLVSAMATFDAGSGPALYVGGSFGTAGNVVVSGLGRWDGEGWSGGGAIAGGANALHVYDDGSGPALYVGGNFFAAGGVPAEDIARWNGTSWSALGTGIGAMVSGVEAITGFDDGSGPGVYAGGIFTTAGGAPATNIAKWNGSAWSALGSGTNARVHALTWFDDGSGAALYAGGDFTTAGGTSAPYIARWNGSAWSSVGGGMNFLVYALTVHDDGSGPALYAGGSFSMAGGVPASGIAKWNGSAWSALGSGTGGVRALLTFDDGTGSALYVGGTFGSAGGMPAARIARWNGTSWSALGAGIGSGGVTALGAFDDGADGAADLYVGGSFMTAGGNSSPYFAQWFGCEPGTAYCFGDGIDALVTADCPCANFGDPGRGCANTNSTLGGARLYASGATSPNTVLFTCNGIPNNNLCTFLRGTVDTQAGAVFGDGVKCASGTIIRFGQQMSGQGGNASNTVTAAAATVAPGNTRYYVLQYRNPAPAFCPPETFNASNGYTISW